MSAEGLHVDLRDGCLFLTLANPPVNELTPSLVNALLQAVTELPPGLRGIVLSAEGAHFSSYLAVTSDLSDLPALCRAVADCPVPVVAVLQGRVTGPGAELALAARARLSAPSLRIAFSDVTLGLCPMSGSTRRLPRLIGARAALGLLTSGRPVAASEALALGLIDGITDNGPIPAAARLARALALEDILVRPAADPALWQAAVAEARADTGRMPAVRRIIDCVEAALLLPEANAQDFETTARADLRQTPEATGLRAAALAERRALALPPVLARLQPLSIDRVGLLGVAADLARLAVAALSREVSVVWTFPDDEARRAGVAAVEAAIAKGEASGTLAADRAQQMRDRLTAGTDLASLALLPVLIADRPVGTEDGWGGLPGAALVRLGGAGGEMGLALPPAGRVCELVLPSDVLPLSRATTLAAVRRIGLTPVLVNQRPVVGARMADAGRTAIAWLIARGVPRRQISAALQVFGLSLPDPVSIEAPTILRIMPAAEIVNRWLAALANEGARLLEEGLVRWPSDLDHLMVAGEQFPRWQGGPMYQADRRGLPILRQDLRGWGNEARLWSPAPLIDRLVTEGRGFVAWTPDLS